MDTKKVLVFNAELQKETEHTLDIDGNGEIVLTCVENGHFIKFPAGTTADQLKVLLVVHKQQNEGQLSVAAIDAEKQKLIDALTAPQA